MKEFFVKGKSLPEAYHKSLKLLSEQGEEVGCSDYNTKQKEVSMTIVIDKPFEEPIISKLTIGGYKELQQYQMEILDGILDFEIEVGNWAYTYHNRIAPQISFVVNELKRNSESRRAVIIVRDWKHDIKSKDPACLNYIQYFVRNNKLDCKVLFRSNDAVEATFFNIFALIKLQEKIANELQLEVGSYTHRANSFHVYEKDYKLLDGYIKRLDNNKDTTYEYEGFFKELMEESIAQILKEVNILKERALKKLQG